MCHGRGLLDQRLLTLGLVVSGAQREQDRGDELADRYERGEIAPCLMGKCDKLQGGYALVRDEDTKARRDVLRAKCFVVAAELGMTAVDRHELSVQVVGHQRSTSWGAMTYAELEKLADYMAGHIFLTTIFRDRLPT